MSVPAWYNEKDPHIAPLFKDEDMTSPQNKKNMTWYLNTMLNGQHGAFIDKETASCALVPCILAAGSDLMERHKKYKVGK
jgi:PAB1-binding protein PBP1